MSDSSSPASEPTRPESVAELIERLGFPPDDVWQRFLDEASVLPGRDLPGGDLPSRDLPEDGERDLSPESAFWRTCGLDRHGCLVELNAIEIPEPDPGQEDADSSENVLETNFADSDASPKPNRTAKRSWRIPAALAAGLIGLGMIGWLWPSTEPSPVQIADASAPGPAKKSTRTTRAETLRKPTLDVPAISASPIDSIELDNVVAPPAAPSSTVDFSSAAFSLDALIPAPVAVTIPDPDSEMEPESDANMGDGQPDPATADDPTSEPSLASSSLAGERADVMSDDEGEMEIADAIDAETQPVRGNPSAITFIELPTMPTKEVAVTESVSFDAIDWTNASLAFPHTAVDLLLGPPDGDRRLIMASESKTPIAEWKSDDKESELRWLPGASSDNAAKSLVHGRLKLSPEQVVYLRPSLRADAIPIDLANRDLKLQWDLKAPPEPRQSRLSVDVRVPEEVDLGWIEPIENESPRKARGIAVLNLRDSESVAVVMRIDVQTTKRMSMRLRFGARLDPTMPWQWTDQQDIAATLAAVTNRLEIGEMQSSELDVAIDRADKLRARRTELRLTRQQDQLIAQQKQLQLFAERLTELDRLIANLAGETTVEAELFVSWPDSEQSLLRLTSETQ